MAFFSAVDFDHVLRKETTTSCITPSSLEAVPPGFSMDIYALLERLPEGLGPVADHGLARLQSNLMSMPPALQRVVQSGDESDEAFRFIELQMGKEPQGNLLKSQSAPSGLNELPNSKPASTPTLHDTPLLNRQKESRHKDPQRSQAAYAVKRCGAVEKAISVSTTAWKKMLDEPVEQLANI